MSETPSVDTAVLRARKALLVKLFYANIACSFMVVVISNLFQDSWLHTIAFFAALGVLFWSLYAVYTLARDLRYGWWAPVMVVFALIPYIGLLVYLRLIYRYKAVTGIDFNFFMFDRESAAVVAGVDNTSN